ncbi:hypothetical protein B566_EDAN016622 [Ephemera danica]|nr:hypothetical protein B566_EDAN016622 [Ephemera danica]
MVAPEHVTELWETLRHLGLEPSVRVNDVGKYVAWPPTPKYPQLLL